MTTLWNHSSWNAVGRLPIRIVSFLTNTQCKWQKPSGAILLSKTQTAGCDLFYHNCKAANKTDIKKFYLNIFLDVAV